MQKLDPHMIDCYRFIQEKLGTNAWIPLYLNNKNPDTGDDFFLFSAIAPITSTEQILSQYEWEIDIASFHPGHIISFGRGKMTNARYLRYGREDGIEPILIQRHFHGIKEAFFDVSEEFRHLYNLFYDEHEKKYIIILDDGEEEDVIKISNEMILINSKYLKEYLAVKNANLVLYFNVDRFSSGKFSEFGDEIIRDIKQTDFVTCEISISDDSRKRDDTVIFSRLLGKKIISGFDDFDPETFDPCGVKHDEYLEFIISVDSDGNEILFTCDEEKLANFFGKNKGKPNYVTPVFFKRQVLEKYYANTEKYSIHDGNLFCGGLWSLRLDNNHEKYVIVMLGDLGHLSVSEQRYWRSFNVKPDGGFSEVAFKRDFAAEWTDPSMEDLIFKGKFERFQESWKNKFGWDLFIPLAESDSHFLKKIRVPLKESQSEFDELVLAITKVIIDSINEAKLGEQLSSKEKEEKGISKFKRFLSEKGVKNFEDHIQFLRDLQSLKSTSTSHRKGREYESVAKMWGIGKKRYQEIYQEILTRSANLLDFLESEFLK
jgi:hypothetical protein